MGKGVLTLGEALVDMIPLDKDQQTYQKCPGGAPANVAVGVARLGAPAAFVGKVGRDILGNFLIETLRGYGVETAYLTQTDQARTGLVFVELDSAGERFFEFYIDPSADRFLRKEDVEAVPLHRYHILHVGSISLIGEPSRTATLEAVRRAKARGVTVSFDPNIRMNLWGDRKRAHESIAAMMDQADVAKVSEDELAFLEGEGTPEAAVAFRRKYRLKALLVTLGAKGCWVVNGEGLRHVPAFPAEVVDTTGAGDAFVSGFLYRLSLSGADPSSFSLDELEHFAAFAAVSGGLAVSAKGAMTALPTLEEVEKHFAAWRR